MRRAWLVYLCSAATATVVYFRLPESAHVAAYNAIAVSAAAAMLVGVFRHRPEPRVAWLLLAFGILCTAGGDILFGSGQTVPSPADMLYISAYPLLGLGLFGIRSWAGTRPVAHGTVVALFITALIGFVSWAFLIFPAGDADTITTASKVVALGYPAMDLVLIVLIFRSLAASGFSSRTFRLLGVGFGLMLVADAVYAVQNFGTSYEFGSAIDAAWLLSYAFLGSAVLHPSVGDDTLVMDVDWEAPVATGRGAVATETMHDVRLSLRIDLRFGNVVIWAGRMLLGLAIAAVFLGAKWGSGPVVILGGGYATTGLLMWLAGSRSAYA